MKKNDHLKHSVDVDAAASSSKYIEGSNKLGRVSRRVITERQSISDRSNLSLLQRPTNNTIIVYKLYYTDELRSCGWSFQEGKGQQMLPRVTHEDETIKGQVWLDRKSLFFLHNNTMKPDDDSSNIIKKGNVLNPVRSKYAGLPAGSKGHRHVLVEVVLHFM